MVVAQGQGGGASLTQVIVAVKVVVVDSRGSNPRYPAIIIMNILPQQTASNGKAAFEMLYPP